MKRQRTALVGRNAEIAALCAAVRRPALVALRGDPGIGKTAVLSYLRDELAGKGCVTVAVSGAAEHPEWDLFGVCAILGSIREEFEKIDAGPRLTDAIDVVSRLCTAETYALPGERYRLLHALGALFSALGVKNPATVIVEDAHRIAQPAAALAAMRSAGNLVVVSCSDEQVELCALADDVVDLAPLTEKDADTLLRQLAGVPVDEMLQKALQDQLGPWYRNPGTLVSTVAELRARERLVTVHGHLCLCDPAEPIPLPASHELCAEVGAIGVVARDLVLLAAADAEFGVDEVPVLAAAFGGSPLGYGRTVDRLVFTGVLTSDTAGRLHVGCRALATAVAKQAAVGRARVLHRAMAQQLLEADVAGRPSILASQVAAAGRDLPARSDIPSRLREEERLAVPLNPALRAHGRYAAWWHTGPGPERAQLTREVVRLLIRSGEFTRLAEFVSEVVTADDWEGDGRCGLAAAAVLASVHIGHRVPLHVLSALTGPTDAPPALAFCEGWFAGAVVRLADVQSAFTPLARWCSSVERLPLRQRVNEVVAALALRDLVPAFVAVLGPDYRAPGGGPLATHHRVCKGHAGQEWADALSAARALEIDGNTDMFGRQATRLLAAEMCSWRGEDRRATGWLASAPEDSAAFAALHGWVLSGLQYHAGDLDGVFRTGRSALRRGLGRGETEGIARLVRRIAVFAVESGRMDEARRWQEMAEAWHMQSPGPESYETVLYVRGLVTGDDAAVGAAEQLARRRGNQFDLALACQLAARVADEPRTWLREAYEIARAVEASRLMAWAKRSLESCGVVVPMTRARREHLTEVELRIIELIRSGRTNRQIALAIRISEKTVANHLTRLFAKAGCRTRHGLAMSALGGGHETVGA